MSTRCDSTTGLHKSEPRDEKNKPVGVKNTPQMHTTSCHGNVRDFFQCRVCVSVYERDSIKWQLVLLLLENPFNQSYPFWDEIQVCIRCTVIIELEVEGFARMHIVILCIDFSILYIVMSNVHFGTC